MPANKWNHHTTTSGLATAVADHTSRPTWRLEMVRHDGGLHLTTFPMDTLEWRVAEYGVDREDIDGLLDIIIHEQFMLYDDPLDADLVLLHAAGSQQEAREAHLERIHRIKTQRTQVLQQVAAKKPHPFDIIRQNHGITTEGIAEKVHHLTGWAPNYAHPARREPHRQPSPQQMIDENAAAEAASKISLKVIGS